MKLIPNWRQSYRRFSMQALAAIASIQMVTIVCSPGFMEHHVPFLTGVSWADLNSMLTLATAVLGAIGHFIDQGLPTGTERP